MEKVYIDAASLKDCAAFFAPDVEMIFAGTTVYSMSVSEKNKKYQQYADEYDIHFLFDDDIPVIDFYTVPQVDIMAVDSNGGYIGTIGQVSDLESDALICYIDKNRNCYLAAENGADFLKRVSMWKEYLKPYEGIKIYNTKADAEKENPFWDGRKETRCNFRNKL